MGAEQLTWQGVVHRVQEETEQYALRLLNDRARMEGLERLLLFESVPLLRKLRPFVDNSVVKELMAYSPEKLSQVIKSKLYHDLQMIRINGSLVGAVLGGLFYVASYLIRGGLAL